MNTPPGFIRAVGGALFIALLGLPPLHADTNVVLKQDDVVRLDVFEEPDLSTSTRILKSGEVVLPLIGTVKLAGLTIAQANEQIRELYARDYLVDPKITMTVDSYSQDFVSVIGAVRAPGQFPLPPGAKFDLSAALASAGGLGPDANPSGITVTRADGKTATYTAASLQGGFVVPLRGGDRVVVSQSAFVNKTITILGQVRRTGPVAFPTNGRLDIMSAIAAAGGFTELANPRKVNINRKGKVITKNVKELTERGEERYYLEPDDIVTVTERIF